MAVSGKQEINELSRVTQWRQRINAELQSQLKYGEEWGQTVEEGRRPPATLDEQIAAKEAELAALKAELRSLGHADDMRTSTRAAGIGVANAGLESFKRVETCKDKEMRRIRGTMRTRGAAESRARRAAAAAAQRATAKGEAGESDSD